MSENQLNQPTPEQPQSQTGSSKVPAPSVAAKPEAKSVPARDSQSFLQKVGTLWQSIVGLVRSILPVSVKEKVPDPILNAAIAAILIFAVGSTFNILSGKPAPKIADRSLPGAMESPANFPDFVAPETPQLPDSIAPSQPKSAKFKSKLPDLEAPRAPKPVEIVQPPPLTPEQSLIAGIQNQVSEITNRLGAGLVKSVQANFASSILTVKVAEDWYGLSAAEQNQLANQMWQEANSLDFSKLEIANLSGKLIARSPVVGSEMIILERRVN